MLISTVNSGVPIATGGPSLIYEGKDALLTCVVSENRANHTVIWKKSDEILTAGMVRVTSDTRISVLHDESEWKGDPKGLESGGEVWVLLVRRLTTEDSGSYICELNSEPVLRSIHILLVKSVSSNDSNITTTTESSDVYLVPHHSTPTTIVPFGAYLPLRRKSHTISPSAVSAPMSAPSAWVFAMCTI
ncbi:unnamed protein product [Ceratitis capitata]|uniref:(Mediterranean fruit fly) hypothetical protein n=1 Tax=Ceratitis capitata TaxID=7213 RepID=A0A811V437_CERCA|nr:unnamed protein product [Ceratitis capitata]